MNWSPRREQFRKILTGKHCVHPASVFDPISARIAEDLGFEVGMFAGSVASMTVLGAPDLIVLTLSEFAHQAYRINRAGELPLLVDADHGYGNALNVKRTVEELETAGVAALTIEDTNLPQQFGMVGTTRLIPITEGVGKMKAAIEGRSDPSLVIAGRTSAISMTGLEDTILRAKAYEAAGVDAMFFTGVQERAQLDALAEALIVPILLGGTSCEIHDLDYLSARRVRIALQGHQPFLAAVNAVRETLKALREGTQPDKLPGVASSALMKRVTRDNHYRDSIDEFLGEG